MQNGNVAVPFGGPDVVPDQIGTDGGDASLLAARLGTSLQVLYDAVPVALAVIDRDGRYIAVNTLYATVHGLTPEAMVGCTVSVYLPGGMDALRKDLAKFDAGHPQMEREVAYGGRHFLIVFQPVRSTDGVVQGVTSALIDITARKHLEEASAKALRQWQFQASHDHLTGLGNRRKVDNAIANLVRNYEQNGSVFSVLMMDVDYFKSYNDLVGHQRGDECLRSIAAILRAHARRTGDLAGRYGGEEFIAVLPDTDVAAAWTIAQRIRDDIRAAAIAHPCSPYQYVTMSIGIAMVSSPVNSIRECRRAILDCADRALYWAKSAGRNTVCVYPPNIRKE